MRGAATRRCGASSSIGTEADAGSPPAPLRAGVGCGQSAASLVVNDVTTSPPPRSLHLSRKRHQRKVRDFRSTTLVGEYAAKENDRHDLSGVDRRDSGLDDRQPV